MEFLIVLPMAFVAGFVDSIAGGGGLISLPAFLFAGIPVHAALATNKLQGACGTAVATIRYALNGYMVRDFVVVGVAMGLLGSFLGSNLALAASDGAIKVIMLLMLFPIAFYVLRTRDLEALSSDPLPKRRALVLTALIALVVGAYDGFYGPGTGTFLMLLLTGVAHAKLTEAAGTTKAINLATNFSALVVFLVNGQALIALGLAAAVFNIAGNWVGAKCFTRKGSAITRPIMIVVIVLFAIKLVVDLLC